MSAHGSLARIDQARQMLAEARTLEDVRQVRDYAEAARAYAKIAGLSREAQDNATAIKFEAERKMGEMLAATERHAGGDPTPFPDGNGVGSPPTLADLGISRHESSEWQALGRLDDDQFNAAVEATLAEGSTATRAVVTKARSRKAAATYATRAAEPKPVPVVTDGGVLVLVADARAMPLAGDSIDLTITSPPYGLGVAYGGEADDADAWVAFMRDWLAEAYRVSTVDGRLALNVPLDTTVGGYRATYAEAVMAAQAAGWTYRTTIVWDEGNITRAVARGSVDSAAAPHIIARVEMIALFSKGDWKRESTRQSDIEHDEWLAWTNGLWKFGGESRPWEGHPAPFPEELPRRLVKLLSFQGDTILDPFCGSGTSLVAARRLGRLAVGLDASPESVASARRRLATMEGARGG